ncbi:hypothetical protein D3C80_1923100 [compost metagenome]
MAIRWLEVDFNNSTNSKISDRNRIRSPMLTLHIAPEVMGTRNRTSLSTDAGPSTASGAFPPSRITRL